MISLHRLLVAWSALFVVITQCHQTSPGSYKILMITLPGMSHVLPMLSIADGLANRGHEVTVVVSKSLKLSVPNAKRDGERAAAVTVVHYEDKLDVEAMFKNMTTLAIDKRIPFSEVLQLLTTSIEQMCRSLASDNEPLLRKLEESGFDFAVVDYNYIVKCACLVVHRLGIPFATYTDGTDPLVMRVPWLPSFVPSVVGTSYSDRMSFVERLINAGISAGVSTFGVVREGPADVLDTYRKRYGHFGSLDDIAARSQLWLITRDHINDYARPTMPHVINVGGLTGDRSTAEMPEGMKEFVEGAPNGAIVVSFGSMISTLPEAIAERLLTAFRLLDLDGYRVIFRLTNLAENAEIPKNVLIGGWIPQADLLAHRAVKLFITHCGNSGRYEALYHGVPMIAFPLAVEQSYNAKVMENRGFGIAMDIHTFRPEDLAENVRRIMTEPFFRDNVRKASAIFRSDPQSPAEKAAYWIEHVCRFGGDHLRSGGQDLPLYAYLLLDVLALVLLVVGVAVCCVAKLTCCLRRRCSRLSSDYLISPPLERKLSDTTQMRQAIVKKKQS